MSAAATGSPVAPLERELAAFDRSADPTGWALLAGRVALARTELGDPAGALELIDSAVHVLTAARAPLEHGRLLLVAATAHRATGNALLALELFTRAAQMLEGRAGPAELAAARSNVGLVGTELGRIDVALEAFDGALCVAPIDEHRLRASLHINRAQAHLAGSRSTALEGAKADFDAAAAITNRTTAPIQHGHAQQGLGSIALAHGDLAAAAAHFESAMATFTPAQFPFQHAVASHNLGLALSNPAFPAVVRQRALFAFEVALTLFDPQRQLAQWSESYRRAADVEAGLAVDHVGWQRDDHVAALLGELAEHDRLPMARTRLGHIAQRPDPHRRRAFASLAAAGLRRSGDAQRSLLRATLTVLMEMPDDVFRSGLAGQIDAHRGLVDNDAIRAADRCLDEAIHDLLHGPQRVRVRDLLEEMGWERP